MAIYKLKADQVLDQLFKLSPHVRYAALCQSENVTLKQRVDLQNANSAETEHYEELLINPALLTMLSHRGNIDCGGLHYVLIRYGDFFQYIQNITEGHISVAFDSHDSRMQLIDELETFVKNVFKVFP